MLVSELTDDCYISRAMLTSLKENRIGSVACGTAATSFNDPRSMFDHQCDCYEGEYPNEDVNNKLRMCRYSRFDDQFRDSNVEFCTHPNAVERAYNSSIEIALERL